MANGWSTFETWKLWHELFIDLDQNYYEQPVDAEWCKNYVEVVLELGELNDEGFIGYARSLKDQIVYSWLTKVDWQEIADALNDELDGVCCNT